MTDVDQNGLTFSRSGAQKATVILDCHRSLQFPPLLMARDNAQTGFRL
jgi:hypothetical protein